LTHKSITMTDKLVHPFNFKVARTSLPHKFTYPFHYTAHPLCVAASETVQQYICTQEHWTEELKAGKMFGVLVVENQDQKIGFLAAYSGNLGGRNNHPYFVPPVFDMLQNDGFFKIEEQEINFINRQIEIIASNKEYLNLTVSLEKAIKNADEKLLEQKKDLKLQKEKRDLYKKSNPLMDVTELEMLNKISQHEKGEYKRLEKTLKEEIRSIQNEIEKYTLEINNHKTERKTKSYHLQQKLFDQFKFMNIKGENKSLCDIFEQTAQKTPPAGAGECAAPKLLQYAFNNELQPIAMAEFWWGNSPKNEIRLHGNYYPACMGKCQPILSHMLQGLNVDNNPLSKTAETDIELEVVFEDDYLLIINKPSGLLSMPGKSNDISVHQLIKAKYPNTTGPLLVHRLDMSTSGLLLIAKKAEIHKSLQLQFKNRTIKKKYIAILNGILNENSGNINLPLSPDYNNRPCQMVDFENGKTANTLWRALERKNNTTRVEFEPITGRTHQLRIHAAHHLGLNTPIVGDELYGQKSDRLFLHAQSLEFTHPITAQIISVFTDPDF